MSLKLPWIRGNSSPSKSLTWDVKTWMAAPVVKPLTKHSDNRNDKIPRRRTYIKSCKEQKYCHCLKIDTLERLLNITWITPTMKQMRVATSIGEYPVELVDTWDVSVALAMMSDWIFEYLLTHLPTMIDITAKVPVETFEFKLRLIYDESLTSCECLIPIELCRDVPKTTYIKTGKKAM